MEWLFASETLRSKQPLSTLCELVVHMKWNLTTTEGKLGEGGNGLEAVLVLPEWMPERLLEAAPGLELGIDAFMACPGIGSGSRVLERDDMPWSSASWMRASFVCFNHLTSSKHTSQSRLEDLEVRPLATGKGPMNPNNLTSLNADCYFISHTSLLELVTVPFL